MDKHDEGNLYAAVNSTPPKGKGAAESKEEKDRLKAQKNWDAYIRIRDSGHMDWVDEANKFDRYYRGDQWAASDIKTLEEEGRPWLTVNMILPTINAMIAEQTATRSDVTYKPAKDGATDTAFALSKLYLAIDQANQLDWKETEVFTDGVITDRGFYDVRINTDENIFGDIEIKTLDSRRVLVDADAQDYDPATWKEVTVATWMSLEDIEATYGKESADKLESAVEGQGGYGPDSVLFTEHRFGTEAADSSWETTSGDSASRRLKKVRVLDRQWAHYKRVKHFIDPSVGDTRPVPETWDDMRVSNFAAEWGLGVVKRTARVIHWTVSADSCLIHDGPSPYRTFTIIPYFPYFRRGKPIGAVRNLISPQDQINKLDSQELHIVNTTANSGWTVEQGALTNMTIDDLAEQGAKTGIVLEFAPDRQPPAKIQPNQIPAGIDRISQKAMSNLRTISAVNEGMFGVGPPRSSGAALLQRAEGGRRQMAGPLENLARTRHLLAKKVLELLQQFYTEARVVKYIDVTNPQAQDQELMINQLDTAGQLLNDITLGTYSVHVSSAPSRDTFRDGQFADALEMRQAGLAIPDDVIVEKSNLLGKAEIAERIRQSLGMGAPSEAEMEMQQIQQQLAMAAQQTELAKLQQEVEEIASRASLNRAKAESTLGDDGRQLEKLEFELQKKREELALRERLAHITATTRREDSMRKADQTITSSLIQARANEDRTR